VSTPGGDWVEFQFDLGWVRRVRRLLLQQAVGSVAVAAVCVLLGPLTDDPMWLLIMLFPAVALAVRAVRQVYAVLWCWWVLRPAAAPEWVLRVGPDGIGCLRPEHFLPWSRLREATIQRDTGRLVLRFRRSPWFGRRAGQGLRRRRRVLIPAAYGATLEEFVHVFGRHIAMADPSRGRPSWRPVIPTDGDTP
jgi:hypothetical protein